MVMEQRKITLEEGMHHLLHERRVISGLALSYGDGTNATYVVGGNAKEVSLIDGTFVPDVRPVKLKSIFDLASVTKLFTGLSVLMLCEAGCIRLSDTLDKFCPQFSKIPDVRIGELLTFRAPIKTQERVDAQPDRETALRCLFTLEHCEPNPKSAYTDMGAMVLKYVIEATSGEAYFSFLKNHILMPLGMNRTFSKIPEALLADTVCYNYGRIIRKGFYSVDTSCVEGRPHDPKARLLNPDGTDLTGHAGLFSTVGDLTLLAQALLNEKLIRTNTLLRMGLNRTGKRNVDGSYSSHLACMCYAKHPIQTYSEVPSCFGERTISSNGFTGNHFSVDPISGKFMILLCNKIHNRVYRTDIYSGPDSTNRFMPWKDGTMYPVSENFTYLKDPYLKEPIGDVLFHSKEKEP